VGERGRGAAAGGGQAGDAGRKRSGDSPEDVEEKVMRGAAGAGAAFRPRFALMMVTPDME
jgi:hypothetical protein